MAKGHRQSLARHKAVKSTVKYLSRARPNIATVLSILNNAPDEVIEAISNAALNAREGDVHLTPAQKALFRAHEESFNILTDRHSSIADKRRHLLARKRKNTSLQEGGAFPIAALVVPLLSTVLSSIGSAFISSRSGPSNE